MNTHLSRPRLLHHNQADRMIAATRRWSDTHGWRAQKSDVFEAGADLFSSVRRNGVRFAGHIFTRTEVIVWRRSGDAAEPTALLHRLVQMTQMPLEKMRLYPTTVSRSLMRLRPPYRIPSPLDKNRNPPRRTCRLMQTRSAPPGKPFSPKQAASGAGGCGRIQACERCGGRSSARHPAVFQIFQGMKTRHATFLFVVFSYTSGARRRRLK